MHSHVQCCANGRAVGISLVNGLVYHGGREVAEGCAVDGFDPLPSCKFSIVA